jgi:hypothetical protein
MPEWKPKILCRLALVKLSPTREAEIVDELSQNLEDRYQEHLASGQSQDAAFRTSLDELNDENLLARGSPALWPLPLSCGPMSGTDFREHRRASNPRPRLSFDIF